MLQELNRLIRRGARWFLRNRREQLDILATIQSFQGKVSELNEHLSVFLPGYDNEIESISDQLILGHVPKALASQIGMMSALYSALDIIEAATLHELPLKKVVGIYFAIGRRLELGWFRDLIKKQTVSNHWEALARAIFRDDLDRLQRALTISIMRQNGHSLDDPNGIIDKWFDRHRGLVKRWEYFISELKAPTELSFTMFAVALRELLDLSQTSLHKTNH
jgi:glutamate dehydrogenase